MESRPLIFPIASYVLKQTWWREGGDWPEGDWGREAKLKMNAREGAAEQHRNHVCTRSHTALVAVSPPLSTILYSCLFSSFSCLVTSPHLLCPSVPPYSLLGSLLPFHFLIPAPGFSVYFCSCSSCRHLSFSPSAIHFYTRRVPLSILPPALRFDSSLGQLFFWLQVSHLFSSCLLLSSSYVFLLPFSL